MCCKLHSFILVLHYSKRGIFITGGGQYGDVYEGIWKRYKKVVAVKTLKVGYSTLCRLRIHGKVSDWLILRLVSHFDVLFVGRYHGFKWFLRRGCHYEGNETPESCTTTGYDMMYGVNKSIHLLKDSVGECLFIDMVSWF